jgi:hypothetical protein
MFATTQNRISMILGVALLAAAFQTSAFAAETTLASNERAAQSAIVGGTEIRAAVSADTSLPSIARAEALAQRVILDVSTPAPHGRASIGQATLSHNEIAAKRSIVDATTSNGTVRHAATAKTVASTLPRATP